MRSSPPRTWPLLASVVLAARSAIELGPVAGLSPLTLGLACTAMNLAVLLGLRSLHDARARAARARPLGARIEAWLVAARWTALVVGALAGARALSGAPRLSSTYVLGALVGGAIAELLSGVGELGLRLARPLGRAARHLGG
ncbi:MAG TPA: hypothetical protein VN751_06770 [Solirubrobacteraceae bacterium]|nr:hypothetical protein [Solirubrobacteraceae bacterium]